MFPEHGWNPHALQWKQKVLTTGPPRRSLGIFQWAGLGALLLTLSHTITLKGCVGKLNAVGIPFSILSPQTYLVNVLFSQSVSCTFTYVSVSSHQTMSSWGGRISLFSVNLLVEQNLTEMTLAPLSHKILIKLIGLLHLFCFSACCYELHQVLLSFLVFSNHISAMVFNHGFIIK